MLVQTFADDCILCKDKYQKHSKSYTVCKSKSFYGDTERVRTLPMVSVETICYLTLFILYECSCLHIYALWKIMPLESSCLVCYYGCRVNDEL